MLAACRGHAVATGVRPARLQGCAGLTWILKGGRTILPQTNDCGKRIEKEEAAICFVGVPGGIRTRVIAVKDQPYVYFQQLAEHGWQLRTAHERHGIRIVVRVLYEATRAYQPMFDLQKKR